VACLEAVAEVLAHGHVRVERVRLEDHGDVAILGCEPRHVAVPDRDAAGAHVLEPGDHPQQSGLAAARGPDEHEKLAVGDLERNVVDRDDVAVGLDDVVEANRSHVG